MKQHTFRELAIFKFQSDIFYKMNTAIYQIITYMAEFYMKENKIKPVGMVVKNDFC